MLLVRPREEDEFYRKDTMIGSVDRRSSDYGQKKEQTLQAGHTKKKGYFFGVF